MAAVIGSFLKILRDARGSLVILVFVVSMALFLDDFLLSVAVPIFPVVLLDQCYEENFPYEGSLNWSVSGSETGIQGKRGDAFPAGVLQDLGDCERSVNTKVGVLFGSQFVIRVLMSLFTSCMSNKFGYRVMMLIGCLLMLLSAIVYSIADVYVVYFIARLIHGFAAIPNIIGGLSLLAYRFRDNDEKRGLVLGIAVSSFAVGDTAGPPFGGTVLFYFGKNAPFIFTVGIIGIVLLAEIFIFENEKLDCEKEDPKIILKMLLDWKMIIASGPATIVGSAFGLLEPLLPVWMISTMDAEEWQLGIVFLPVGLGTIVGSVLLGYFGYKIGRWLCDLIGMLGMAACIALIPIARSFWMLLPLMAVFGFAFGVVDAVSCAIFDNLAEQYYDGAYGSATTLYITGFSMGFILGPVISAVLVNYVTFRWMLWLLSILLVVFAPLCISLRKIDRAPSSDNKNEKMTLIIPTHKPEIVVSRQT